MAATVITIAVEKGGCGKTVTTSNLAYLMGDEGKKVLCLDTDPQGNLTFALTGGNAITSKAFANRSLYDMIDGFRYNTQTRRRACPSGWRICTRTPSGTMTAATRSIWPAIPTCWTISCARSRTSTIIS